MNKELLEEFLIRRVGNNYIIEATDKAYELLELENKKNIDWRGIGVDTIDRWYYCLALVNFLTQEYQIDALVNYNRGNSHDESEFVKVKVFDGGGIWEQIIDERYRENSLKYETNPHVIDEEQITDEILETWAKAFHNWDKSFIYCSFRNGSSGYCFSIEMSFVKGTGGAGYNRQKLKGYPCRIYLEGIEQYEKDEK